nr:TetR/AcrR family transcriptional regulator [uncultured Cohaesibacter sp.]
MIFCQYGFRKASMEDIANAAALSRQSIYKKFGSKEGIFEWAVLTVTDKAFEATMAALSDESKDERARLIEAFDRWAGDLVPIVRGTPHGREILDLALALYSEKEHEVEEAIYDRVARLLEQSGIAKTRQDAEDKVYTLSTCAKGLWLRVDTRQEFTQGMTRVVRSISQ